MEKVASAACSSVTQVLVLKGAPVLGTRPKRCLPTPPFLPQPIEKEVHSGIRV